MSKKVLSLLLSSVLILGSTSLPVNGLVETNEPFVMPVMEDGLMSNNEATDKALEAAIRAVKAKINIPKEYSEFDYNYYGSNSHSTINWNLNWRHPKEHSYIVISLDKDFNFVNFSKYDYSKSNRGIPSYLKDELEDKAKGFIKLIAPDIYRKLDFIEAEYDGIYSNSYTYYYQRIENNVIFPDNNVRVKVDADSGEIRSATIEWLRGAKIPSSSVEFTKNEAAKRIGDKLNMKLTYKTNYYKVFENGQDEYVKKAFLVYEPDKEYISIDAKTGELYLTRSQWIEVSSDDAKNEEADMEMAAGGADGGVLTDEEIAKIRELEKLISKDKAIETVTSNPYLHIDDNLITYTASLNKSYTAKDADNSYVWNITLRDNRPVDYDKDQDYYRAYAYASVDAMTGKVLSFNASIESNYNRNSGKWIPVNVKYDRKYGQNILEKFLKSQVKDRFEKSQLGEQRDGYVAYYKEENTPVYGGYLYRYNRFNEGVEFLYNGINGSVDGVSGKIYNYNSNWDDDIIFESPKDAMTAKEAYDHYISKDGYNLLYEINVINEYDPNYKPQNHYYDYSEASSVRYEIRLVYRPDIFPQYISPFTGDQLDSRGEVYKGREPYVYKDISDKADNRDILLLTDMNIGFEGEYFNPEKWITEGEINLLLEKLGYWTVDTGSEKANTSSKLITREDLAYNFIKRLGLEKVAKISGIYRTGYHDEVAINSDYLGAVALAKGLNLFPNEDSFNPKNNIRRREAVQLLFNYVEVANENY